MYRERKHVLEVLIITIVKTTSEVGDGDGTSDWLAVTGWLVTVCVVEVGVVDTRYGRGARVYTAHRGWLGLVTGISAAATEDVLVYLKVPYVRMN